MPRAPLAHAAVAVTVLSWASAFPAIRLALRETKNPFAGRKKKRKR